MHDTPDSTKKYGSQKFNPRDPEMEMLLRGLLHELRNPLSSILTAAALLQDSPPGTPAVDVDDESQMLLDVVKKESLRLNYILTEFADYIKLPLPTFKGFDLAQAARTAVHELQREEVLAPPIEVHDQLPATCEAWGDESQVRLALTHILRNAVEAMPNGGELWLSGGHSDGTKNNGDSTHIDEDSVFICVTDSGRGFTSESRDRAFQPFYSSKEHGVGLGLSSVLSLIEAANGHVWLEENSQFQSHAPQETNTPHPSQKTSSLSICFQLPRSKS